MADLTSRLTQVNVLTDGAGRNSWYSNIYSKTKDIVRDVGRAVRKSPLVVGALAAVIGVEGARALPVAWSSYSDVVPVVSPAGPYQGQPIDSVNYTSSSTVAAPNNFSAVYFIEDGEFKTPVGGFDVVNGNVVKSSFNGLSTWYGLTPGDTVNSGEGANPQNTFGGYWEVFYDTDGNGNYGLADTDVQGVFLSRAEQLDSIQYAISNSSSYSGSPGSFTFTTDVPEPSALALLGVGAGALALRRRFSKRDKSNRPKSK